MRKISGIVTFKSGYVDITDPCYDNDTWCRLRKELPIGEYKYEAVITDNTNGWGERVKTLRIQRKGWKSHRTHKLVGYIGVDAGLAGFFDDKPDYKDTSSHDEWCTDVCEGFLFKHPQGTKVYEAHCDNAMRCEGVFSLSGYGDGSYPVYQIRDDYTNEIVGYKIKFI